MGFISKPVRLVKASPLIPCLLVLWLLFVLLAVGRWPAFTIPLDVIGFLALMIVPGALIGVPFGWLKKPSLADACYMFGASLLTLISVPLIVNMVLPYTGIARPIERTPLLIQFTVAVCIAAAAAWIKRDQIALDFKRRLRFARRDYVVAGAGICIVFLSITGAISLNNGATASLTLTMLGLACGYILLLIRWNKRLQSISIPAAITLLSISLLFMTSLRGWYTTGHDIQLETRVFELVNQNGNWQLSRFRDPYNTCLSITLLPAVFAKLLKQTDPYVYKVYFQLIFATVPAMIYINMRRFVSAKYALIAVVYFIAYPTFFSDMPMLNRQEIAFVFLGLMLLALFDTKYSLSRRRALLVIFGLGMILSHYSTTYATIAVLLIAYALRPGVMLAIKFARSVKSMLGRTRGVKVPLVPQNALLTLTALLILINASLVWSAVATQTSSGLNDTVRQTLSSVKGGLSDSSRSNDANSILSAQPSNPQALFNNFTHREVAQERSTAPARGYYAAAAYAQYPMKTVSEQVAPLTGIGRKLSRAGIDPLPVISNLKSASPKLIALFAFTGMVYVVIRQKQSKMFPPEAITLALASLIFVASQIILPVVSIDYGVARAYQQGMFVLGLFIVVGSFAIFSWIPWKRLALALPVVLMTFYFLSNTGFITQLTGGYAPQMNLSNSGTYYDLYYPHQTEVAAEQWLNQLFRSRGWTGSNQPEIQAERYIAFRTEALTPLNVSQGIYPGQLQPDSFVILGYTNVHKRQTTFFYNGDLVTYHYPARFLDDNKNLIYSNDSARIYQ